MRRFIETGDKKGRGKSLVPLFIRRWDESFMLMKAPWTIAEEGVYIVNPDGSERRKTYIEYAGGQIYSLYESESELREKWVDQKSRSEIIEGLKKIGIEKELLAKELKFSDADPF